MDDRTKALFQPSQMAHEASTVHRSRVVPGSPVKEGFVNASEPCELTLAQPANANLRRRTEKDDQTERMFEFFIPPHNRTRDNGSWFSNQRPPQQGGAFLTISLLPEGRISRQPEEIIGVHERAAEIGRDGPTKRRRARA